MEAQIAQFLNRGMNQDISVSKATNEFAFKNFNIRITAINDNTLLSVTNERLPRNISVTLTRKDGSTLDFIPGNYLGHAVINNYLVLFTTHEKDYIIVLTYNDVTACLEGVIKYEGDLGFKDVDYIDTLPYYESEEVQKVYWIDGVHQPRVINIKASSIDERSDTQFDFNPIIVKFPNISVVKEYSGMGLFPAGVIQYFISYYNKFGPETGIVCASDLHYITEYNRAAGSDESIVCNFRIVIDNIDTTYDYVRVYSLQRTSLNNTPICKIVADINIDGYDTLSIVDTNNNSESIDPSQLLFLGGDEFIASTIAQKDDTLFLGNLEIKSIVLPAEVKDSFKDSYDADTYISKYIKFEYKKIPKKDFQLNKSEKEIKTFKKGERYRFALQFQNPNLKWSTPIWIGDSISELTPYSDEDYVYISTAVVELSESIINVISNHFVNYRLLMAEPTNADRKILAQGIVSPTVFNYEQRVNSTGPYAQASWILRPRNGTAAFEHLEGLGNKVTKTDDDKFEFINLPTCEIQNSINKVPGKFKTSSNQNFIISIYTRELLYEYTILKISGTSLDDFGEIDEVIATNHIVTSDTSKASKWIIEELLQKLSLTEEGDLGISQAALENSFYNINYNNESTTTGNIVESTLDWYYGWMSKTPGGTYISANNGVSNGISYGGIKKVISSTSDIVDNSQEYKNNFYVDSSIVTFHSPEIDSNEELFDNSDLHFNIIGIVPINNITSKIDLQVNPAGISKTSGVTDITTVNSLKTLVNAPLFQDYTWDEDNVLNKSYKGSYYIYLWNKKGSIIGQTTNSRMPVENEIGKDPVPMDSEYAILEKKIIGNRYYSDTNVYFDDAVYYDIKPIVFNTPQVSTKLLHTTNKEVFYQGNYEFIAPTTLYKSFSSKLNYYKSFWRSFKNFDMYSEDAEQVDPVSIKYKTTSHLVFELHLNTPNYDHKFVLPLLNSKESTYYYKISQEYGDISELYYPWIEDSGYMYYKQQYIQATPECDLPYFYIGEISRPDIDISIIYGGVSENALERLVWIPASIATPITSKIEKSYGDTYYQRWDCLHTYPFTREDQNSIIDVASFMVETHVNVEGRYDKNKIAQELLSINEETYSKVNDVYSQTDNYFTYNILDDKFSQTKYGNQIAFSLQKTPTSEIDTWCNISLASSFNLNGLYGKLTKLVNVNDTILAFQDKALSVINFNNRTALSTESGVPIEIANSGKVDGYTIISSNIGCQNKQSICSTSSGVYFIDNYNKSMYGFNKEGLSNISSKGMSIWFKNNITGKEKVFYDSLNSDIYITNDNSCLVFNEGLQSFTSFLEYSDISALFNFNGHPLMLNNVTKENVIFKKMFDGEYTNNYSIEYKVNPEPLTDKTFGNIEFIADCLDTQDIIDSEDIHYNYNVRPFDSLEVWNEYQKGVTNLNNTKFKYPNFEKKFRIWRIDIPRDSSNYRDRIRNPWVYLKLSKSKGLENFKMVFHNLLVKYYK